MIHQKKIVMLMVTALGLFSGVKVNAQASFEERQTTAGNIRMTVNNLGMIGNAFRGS